MKSSMTNNIDLRNALRQNLMAMVWEFKTSQTDPSMLHYGSYYNSAG